MWIHRSEFRTLNTEHGRVACKGVVAAAHATFNASLQAEWGRVSGRSGSCKVWHPCRNIHARAASIAAPRALLPRRLITRHLNPHLSCRRSCSGRRHPVSAWEHGTVSVASHSKRKLPVFALARLCPPSWKPLGPFQNLRSSSDVDAYKLYSAI